MLNPEDISDPITAMNMSLVLMAKAFKLNYSIPTNNNQRIPSNLRNRQIAQPVMNMGQDTQMQMVGGNGGNQFRYLGSGYSECWESECTYCCLGIANQNANWNGNGTFVAAWAEGDLNEIEEVNANYILMVNLQQASTSGTQTDKVPIYDSDGSAKVHHDINCYDNDIFNMFTQEEQYTKLLEPIYEPHQVQQNDSNVISTVLSMEQSGGTVEQYPATVEETRAYFESLYNNLAIEVEKVNTVNRKMKETNADLTTELARYKNQEKCFEINQEKYDKLERCYQKSVYQEQCITKKIDALHLNSAKQITTLNEEIANLNNQLSKEKSMVSFLQEENKMLKSDFKTREDELIDKQIQLENKIKELDNILAKSHEEWYFSDASKMANVSNSISKPISMPNEEFSDDISPNVAWKFINEVKSTIVTLQCVVKQKMTLDIHHWSSTAHQEVQNILKDEIASIVNQVDARVQNFKIQFLKEAAKFVRDFKSLAKEVDVSLDKHKDLEFENEHLLRAVVSQDIMYIVQNNSVVDTSNLQNELDRTKEKLETCIIKKKKEYVVLWNDWYKKCEECKHDRISYDKAYNDMQHQIERLQAQLGYLKGKSMNTQCASDTLDPMSQKLEDENAQTKIIIDSLQEKLNDTIYENAKLRAQLFDKVPPKVVETNDLSNPVTSNSVPITTEANVVKNDKVIALGMFMINPFKTSWE
ncbi:hypothetical protein Tco_0568093 [Tanacetum coccineum]